MKKFIMLLVIVIITSLSIKVDACIMTYEQFTEEKIKTSMVVGEYIFDTYEGYSPNLEDIAIAARTIPEEQSEYVYMISNYGAYYTLDLITENFSDDVRDFPLLDVTYKYMANIRTASEDQYKIYTCEVDWINVLFTTLETVGEGEYKTSAVRTVNINSTSGVSEAKYCLTSGTSCEPDKVGTVSSGMMKVEYESAIGGQRVCVEAKDTLGNTSGVVCDSTLVKVDTGKASITATDEWNTIIEKEPHPVDELFDVELSISGGDLTYYYYDNDGNKNILTNLSDLPSGDIRVELRVVGGNGEVVRAERVIQVLKNKVTYDYQTNGGDSSDISVYETTYKGRANLSEKAYKEGYEFVGWNTDKDAKIGLDYLEVNENITLYAIFKKEVTAQFEIVSKKDAIPAVAEYQSVDCEKYNKEETCEITIPSISARVGYIAEGWTEEKFSINVKYTGGEKVDIKDDISLYSVTKERTDTTATFVVYKDNKIVEEVLSCSKYNGEDTCTVDRDEITSDPYQGLPLGGFTESMTDVKDEDDFELTTGKKYYAFYEDFYTITYVSGEGKTAVDKAGVYFVLDLESVQALVKEVTVPNGEVLGDYTFLGYRKELGNGDIDVVPGDVLSVENDITYYGIYEREVEVTYGLSPEDEEEGNVTGIPDLQKGKMYYLSGKKEIEGYKTNLDNAESIAKTRSIFQFWRIGETQYDAGEEIEVVEDVLVTPTWIIDGCRVYFDFAYNGGVSSTKSSMTYYTGDTTFDVTTVTARRPGWEFIGWSTDKDARAGALGAGDNWLKSFTSSDITVYAMFKKNINIDFVTQDPEVFQINSTRLVGTIYNRDTTYPVTMRDVVLRDAYKDKFEFIKWSQTKTDTDLTAGGYQIDETVQVSANTTFYTISKELEPLKGYFYYVGESNPVYEEVNCYRYNGSNSCEITPPNIESEYNNGILTGYSLLTGRIEEPSSYVISTDTNYFGVYDRILSIQFHSGILKANTVTRLINMQYLTRQTDVLTIKASIEMEPLDGIAGFNSLGWRNDEDAGNAEYLVGDTISVAEDREFFGVYDKQVTVSYVATGADSVPESETKQLLYNTVEDTDAVFVEFTLADAPYRHGFKFLGWSAGDTSNLYEAGETVELNTNVRLVAMWEGEKFTVTYDCATNGGEGCSVTSETLEVPYLNNVDLTVQAYKEGYEFVGWSDSPNAKMKIDEKVMPSEDITLYAIFRQALNVDWILVDPNAGTLESERTYCYRYNKETECRVTTGNIIANEGYTVGGWTTIQDSLEAQVGNNETTVISEDMIFYSITRVTEALEGVFYYGSEEEKGMVLLQVDENGNKKADVGDVVSIGSEQFYVISDDGIDLKLLAMYNLNVGGEYDSSWVQYDEPTGIQDSAMLGYTSTDSVYKGVTPFSSSSNTYTGSIVEEYVNTYSEYIRESLGVDNSATLLSKDELDDLGCSSDDNTCEDAPVWVRSTSYWTNSSINTNNVWNVSSNGNLSNNAYSYNSRFGVRPVITVDSSLVDDSKLIVSASSRCYLYNGATSCSITAPLVPTTYKNALFETWSSSSTSIEEVSYELTENTNYYAQYIRPVSIIYHDGETDNMITDTNTVEYLISETSDNEKLPVFEIRTPTAIDTYTTLGWTEDAESYGEVTEVGGYDKEISYSLELYARYEREISLTYNTNGGTPVPDVVTVIQNYHVLLGASRHTVELVDASTLTRPGYTIDGWYTENDGGSKVTSVVLVESSVVYARWIPSILTVTFDANEGELGSASKIVTFGNEYGELPVPTRQNYKFLGWYTEESGGTQITESSIVTIAENHTLYAQWESSVVAIYSETDNSLNFYDLDTEVAVGDTYNDRVVTALFTVSMDKNYSHETVPWRKYRDVITTVTVVDEIKPINTKDWFYGFSEVTTIDVTNLDTSNVTNMNLMFYVAGNNASTFDIIGLDNWDTSQVTDMGWMFHSAGRNATTWSVGDLSKWDTSQVIDLDLMFCSAGQNATTWNIGNISNWDTSQVTDMSWMFLGAGQNATTWSVGDLSRWDTSQVTDMNMMFYEAGQNATTWSVVDLSKWDTSQVTDMSMMFYKAGQYATTWSVGDLSKWDTSQVTNMDRMFFRAGQNTTTWSVGDLSKWNTSQVIDMSNMFNGTGLNATTWSVGDLSNWDTSQVIDMGWMFYLAGNKTTNFDIGDLSNWDTSQVTDMSSMFYLAGQNATTWNIGNISNWDTSQVTDMSLMFSNAGQNATTWNIGDISNWDTSNVTDMSSMFYLAGNKTTNFDIGDLSNWDVSNVKNMYNMFYFAGQNTTVFELNLSNWDVSNVTDMTKMLSYAGQNATTWSVGDLSKWNTSQVTTMLSMFDGAAWYATSLNLGNLNNWDVSNVSSMYAMFYSVGKNATTWNIGDISDWDVSNVTNMHAVFREAAQVVTTWSVGDLSKWDTSQVTDMSLMFYQAGYKATYSLNLSTWNVSNVTNYENFNAGVESKVIPPNFT